MRGAEHRERTLRRRERPRAAARKQGESSEAFELTNRIAVNLMVRS